MSLSRTLPKVGFWMLLSFAIHVVPGCAQPAMDSSEGATGVSARDFVARAEQTTLAASDLEFVYNYLEGGELTLTAEDRIVPGFELKYRPRKGRRAWLEKLASCFTFAPLPNQFARGRLNLSDADVFFGGSGLGGLSFLGAKHEYDANKDRLTLWGIDDTERDPDLMRAPAAHHNQGGDAPSTRSSVELPDISLSLDPTSLSRRATRPGLFRLRLAQSCTDVLERSEASTLSPSSLATQRWTISLLQGAGQGRSMNLSQHIGMSRNRLTMVRRSVRPDFEETYQLGLDTITVVSDLYQSLAGGAEWWFNIGGGAGHSSRGSGWRVIITGNTGEEPHENTVPVVRIVFASRAEAQQARSYFLGE